MIPSFVIKLHPISPWRVGLGPARETADLIYHSDSLYSAITLAMEQFGWLSDWIAATAECDEPDVRFTSCFPFVDDTLFIVPPRNLWPPAPSPRVRWKSARFVPLTLVLQMLKDPDLRLREEEGWGVDPDSECLLPAVSGQRMRAPFRLAIRRSVSVDRLTGQTTDPTQTACLEFSPGCGLWTGVWYSSEQAATRWDARLKACFRLLADSGFGGQRARGFGRTQPPEFLENAFADLPAVSNDSPVSETETPEADASTEHAYWLLSLFSPSKQDQIDWTRGSYSVVTRSGVTASRPRPGQIKQSLQMVVEGSVLFAAKPLKGAVTNVVPEDFPHPVYRSGYAIAVLIPWRVLL
ncbi:MAG: hypothetical protein NZV14_12405 [Bryobacteraceae bacterium]|nr:hypothetical protein [Bryobacteraceae bacterium]MDW8378955.1 hypothetical protein [Bryobacterales bacterium]